VHVVELPAAFEHTGGVVTVDAGDVAIAGCFRISNRLAIMHHRRIYHARLVIDDTELVMSRCESVGCIGWMELRCYVPQVQSGTRMSRTLLRFGDGLCSLRHSEEGDEGCRCCSVGRALPRR